MKSFMFFWIFAMGAAPTGAEAVGGPQYVAEIESWGAQRDGRMRAQDGWLSIVALTFLKPGQNRFGSAPDDDAILPKTVPPHAGSLIVEGRAVRLVVPPGSPLQLNGAPAQSRALRTDAAANPDVLSIGTVTWQIIERGDRL